MGACDVQFTLTGQANEFRVKKAFNKRLVRDREYNGHQDGYSGDTQTLRGIQTHFHKGIFKSMDDAYEYCEKNAEKRGYMIAVHFLTNNKDGSVIDTLCWGLGAC